MASEASTDSLGHIVKKMSPMEWVVIGSAGLGVLLFIRYRKAQQAAASSSGSDQALLGQLSGTGGLAGLLANQNPTGAGPSQQTSTSPLDNTTWAQQASQALIGTGGYTPLDVNQAFSNFLSGQPLNKIQQQIINAAEKLYGAPPLTVPNIQTIDTTPAPAQQTPAPAPVIDLQPVIEAISHIPGITMPPETGAPPPAPTPAPIMDQGQYAATTGNASALIQWITSGGLIAGAGNQGLSSRTQIAADIQDRINKGYITPASGQQILGALPQYKGPA